YFPRMASDAASEQDSRKALETLGPDAGSVVLGPHAPYRQDLFATPFVASLDEQPCHIHYAASTPSLLRLSMSWFPGWRARVDSRELPVLRVDHAMMGVVAPAGEHDLKFRFLELARLGADDFGAGHAVSFADVARRLRWAGESLRHSGPRTSPDYNRMKHPSCGILKRPSRNPESE
ncbi:MAG TPA: hypothetical protein VGS58_21105, partial [Candidatus Sulfopaludibacter sp.]|nr:hypothetical protein [Candidatus Sulfopaludibacter sp.]